MTRTVTLVLVDEEGVLLGAMPAFVVDLPYWQEVAEVVADAQDRYGIKVEVLRLLTTSNREPHGGEVTYLAQLVGELPPTAPRPLAVARDLGDRVAQDESLRMPYARPGGPSETLEWARERLGKEYVSAQQRTWNLSAIWRLDGPTSAATGGGPLGTAWLKQVPPFFAHEAAVLEWATRAVPGSTPPLLSAGPERRMLLGHVAGEDLYESGVAERVDIVAVAHRIQLASISDVDELIAAGVPDRRGAVMAEWIRAELRGDTDHVAAHPASDLLIDLLIGLDEQLRRTSDCGLPDVLVHGDEHPGNAIAWRGVEMSGAEAGTVLLDWGDSYIGQPAFDALRLGVGLPAEAKEQVVEAWVEAWHTSFPDSDPRQAVELLGVVEPLRLAAVYASFLRQIEPTERRYHAADVAQCLDRAVEAALR